MLYMEDFLEMIEHLPNELRDRFTEMREMDLSVQNRVDRLGERKKGFFANCKRFKVPEREEEFQKIREEYAKVIEDSSEKIQNGEECYNLVDRYLRKLDQELHKFKLELEADNRGITEILEKRSLEMDNPPPNPAKENRHPKKHGSSSAASGSRKGNQTIAHGTLATPSTSAAGSHKKSLVFPPDSHEAHRAASPGVLPGTATYPLQHMGAGGSDIAAAASQAIAATQQHVAGRRTSSLKASYEAINLGVQTHEFSIGRELAGATQSAIAATLLGSASEGPPAKRQKTSKKSQSIDPGTSQAMLDVVSSGSLVDDSLIDGGGLSGSPSAEDLLGGSGVRDGEDWNYDPAEPRYCMCNQVSYGDMVACDNEDCPYEWFHYPCVGITAPPKGKWFCPTCLARRKSGRK